MDAFEEPTLSYIPAKIDYTVILSLIDDKSGYFYLQALKEVTFLSDERIAEWLDISVKTYRTYKKPNSQIKVSTKEHALMALSLIKHGTEVFGKTENFMDWLETENFYFDKKAPISFMHTGSGMKFIDDQLTGMEYGDNA
ncbi:MAG: DUF2384 domain-containing protein [Sphingobacteriaceae bacterium]|nr:MAG: DUF2384 domain-containing protein [Sphingobacteriaceae bacterium]